MQVLIFCQLCLKTPIQASKIEVFWGQNTGRSGAMLTPNEFVFLLLGVVTYVPVLAKVDQDMRP